MLNFDYYIPTKIFFGKGQLSKLGPEMKRYGDSVLLVYGGGSIKKTGLYDQVLEMLRTACSVQNKIEKKNELEKNFQS